MFTVSSIIQVSKLLSRHKKGGLKISAVCRTWQNTGNVIESLIKFLPSMYIYIYIYIYCNGIFVTKFQGL